LKMVNVFALPKQAEAQSAAFHPWREEEKRRAIDLGFSGS